MQIILDPPVRGALAARAVLRARPLLHLHLQRAERRDPVAVAHPIAPPERRHHVQRRPRGAQHQRVEYRLQHVNPNRFNRCHVGGFTQRGSQLGVRVRRDGVSEPGQERHARAAVAPRHHYTAAHRGQIVRTARGCRYRLDRVLNVDVADARVVPRGLRDECAV